VAEGGGLLNRYTVISRIEGSNPSVSAKALIYQRYFSSGRPSQRRRQTTIARWGHGEVTGFRTHRTGHPVTRYTLAAAHFVDWKMQSIRYGHKAEAHGDIMQD
jgi:hypothetical protein